MIKSKYDPKITPTTNNLLMQNYVNRKVNEVYAMLNAQGVNVAELVRDVETQKTINELQQIQINTNTEINKEQQAIIGDSLSDEELTKIWNSIK